MMETLLKFDTENRQGVVRILKIYQLQEMLLIKTSNDKLLKLIVEMVIEFINSISMKANDIPEFMIGDFLEELTEAIPSMYEAIFVNDTADIEIITNTELLSNIITYVLEGIKKLYGDIEYNRLVPLNWDNDDLLLDYCYVY